jgi:type IV pilus assembly protein PilM
MIRWIPKSSGCPIGVDIGRRSLKLLQFDGSRKRLIEATRRDLPPVDDDQVHGRERLRAISDALRQASEGRRFQGRRVAICLSAGELLVQNIRVAKESPEKLPALIQQEAASRVPYSMAEAEIRYLDAADVRQGDALLREVVLLAAHRPVIEAKLRAVVDAGLEPVAVDVEPAALLRSYFAQYRRDDDQHRRVLYVNIGASNAVVVIAKGDDILFVKYLGIGGSDMDKSVARRLETNLDDATRLRRHHEDQAADHAPSAADDVARSVEESVRPIVERLAAELSLCVRYHSVTFRGQPLSQMVLGGGEATRSLAEALSSRLDIECELGDPLRLYEADLAGSHRGQWDIAAGLSLCEVKES